MSEVFLYEIYCVTEENYVRHLAVSGVPIVTCPNDSGHTVRAGSTRVVEPEQYELINFGYAAGADPTVSTKILISSTGNNNFTLPDGTDELIGANSTQTLTNKNFDSDVNTITNIDNTNIKSSAAIDASKLGIGTLTNDELSYLSGTTSTVQTQMDQKITGPNSATSGQLVLYDGTTGKRAKASDIIVDSNNISGVNYLELNPISDPGPAPKGKYRIFNDSTTGDLIISSDSGAENNLSSPITYDIQSIESATTISISADDNTYADISGMSLTTSNTANMKYKITFTCNIQFTDSSNKQINIQTSVDDSSIPNSQRVFLINKRNYYSFVTYIYHYNTPIGNGVNIKMQWKPENSSVTWMMTNRQLIIEGYP